MNPSYKSQSGANIRTAPTARQNQQPVNVPMSHNVFDLSYFHYKTQSYGLYEPFFINEVVPGHIYPIKSGVNLQSMSLKAPLMSKLFMNRDFFYIPFPALLPNTWEYYYRNPSQGDDIPEDAQPVIDNFVSSIYDLFSNSLPRPNVTSLSLAEWQGFIYRFLILEKFLSSGSVLYQLGFKIVPTIFDSGGNRVNFDTIFDQIMTALLPSGTRFSLRTNGIGVSFIIDSSVATDTDQEFSVTRSQALDILRYNSSNVIWPTEAPNESITFGTGINGLSYYSSAILSNPDVANRDQDYINIMPIVSYQLACAQFYVNSKVDFLYTSELWRQTLFSLYINYMSVSDGEGGNGSSSFPVSLQFEYNGNWVLYDFISNHFLQGVFSRFSSLIAGELGALYNLIDFMFGHRESLRYGDYFTGARPFPLGVGDTDILGTVDGDTSTTSAVETVQKIVLARYLQNVARTGNDPDEYLKNFFHKETPPDYHFPRFCFHNDFEVTGFNTVNTAENQGERTSTLDTQNSEFSGTLEVDLPGYFIGISWLHMPRAYMQTKDRMFFHRDRFDFFLPGMENIGDQPILGAEVSSQLQFADAIFGYRSRNDEYKLRYSQVSGGFTDMLPGWTYIADELSSSEGNRFDSFLLISPEYIRSQPWEFDRFMKDLSGLSLGHRFHFQIAYMNESPDVLAPMQKSPGLL